MIKMPSMGNALLYAVFPKNTYQLGLIGGYDTGKAEVVGMNPVGRAFVVVADGVVVAYEIEVGHAGLNKAEGL